METDRNHTYKFIINYFDIVKVSKVVTVRIFRYMLLQLWTNNFAEVEVTPCSVVVGYQRFGGPCCSHLPKPGDFNLKRHLRENLK